MKLNVVIRYLFRVVGILIILGLAACSGMTPAATTGTVVLTIGGNVSTARTIQPSISMDVTSYTISGKGPNSATFTQQQSGSTTTYTTSLAPGSWTIQVDAYNSSNTKIGTGQGTATISEGQTTNLSVTVTPLAGSGTLAITLDWSSGMYTTPSVVGSLTPQGSSTATAIPFTVGSTSATYSGTLAAGYYTLTITLSDGSTTKWSDVEAVRIIAGQTSSATYAMTTGSLGLTITTNMENPITITLAGNAASLNRNSNMTVTATCSDTPDSYQWYMNGAAVSGATSSSITIGSALSVGSYTLDLMVTKGVTLSSAGFSFSVVAGQGSGFTANFNDGTAANWVPSVSTQWNVTNQAYQVAGTGTQTWLYSYYNTSYALPNFTYQSDVIDLSPTSSGSATAIYIRCGDGNPTNNSYMFSISPYFGDYWVGTMISGVNTWTGWLDSSVINTSQGATNTLEVSVSGTTMNFYINGTYITSLTDTNFSSGYVGLAMGNANSTDVVDFDNVSLASAVSAPHAQMRQTIAGLKPVQKSDSLTSAAR